MNVPNLDMMEVRELRDFAHRALMLSQYASLKARALEDRLIGHVTAAKQAEHECEVIYSKLPIDWKW